MSGISGESAPSQDGTRVAVDRELDRRWNLQWCSVRRGSVGSVGEDDDSDTRKKQGKREREKVIARREGRGVQPITVSSQLLWSSSHPTSLERVGTKFHLKSRTSCSRGFFLNPNISANDIRSRIHREFINSVDFPIVDTNFL